MPAIGPKLKVLLWIVFAGVALLGANSVYLSSVSFLNWATGQGHETYFYYMMFALHVALGLTLLVPFLLFAFTHLATAFRRPNKRAVWYGVALLTISLALIVTGFVLWRNESIGLVVKDGQIRSASYWIHAIAPLLAIALYVRHRLAGPRIRWVWAKIWGGAVAVFVAAMALLHSHDPREYTAKGPKEGKQYFQPSSVLTTNGQFIPTKTLMMDEYCLKCHQDAYDGWFHSAHHFSSFNNKAYLFSVRETRQVSLKRDGDTKAARWCAGCHDLVPFLSGEFDDPHYDDVNSPSSQAGLTCTSCHSIVHVNSTRGNADFTIEEPQHYPFAFSEDPWLQSINEMLIKAKPEMHKKTFLKPLHKNEKFCSTCHKVNLPFALTHYKDFVRGQNHHDPHHLSGVSGHGARSFYYPPKAMGKCTDCHMNLMVSNDFGAKDFDGQGGLKIHNHLFPGANTGLAAIRGRSDIAAIHAKYLSEKKVRVDLFGIRDGGGIDGKLHAPLRPDVPSLAPGERYLVETVVRTLGVGHLFSQGTADSNEIWVELIVKDNAGKVIGHSGEVRPDGRVDPYSHFINVYMLDKNGNRIDRRNPQDIFTPLYNNQIPPGAGQIVHFALDVPRNIQGPITLEAKVNYRKFDQTYMNYVFGKGRTPELPVVVMAKDQVQLPIQGGAEVSNPPSPIADLWQRWNDYGIGLLLEGGDIGGEKGELRQAEEAFQQVASLDKSDGWVNLARVYIKEGRIPEAREALSKAAYSTNPAYPWVIEWLTGQINVNNGFLDEAITNYEAVLSTFDEAKGFDFSQDYEVRNALAQANYLRSKQTPKGSPERMGYLEAAIENYLKTIALDTENVTAHYGLGLCYGDYVQWHFSGPFSDLYEQVAGLYEQADQAKIEKVDQENDLAKLALLAKNGSPPLQLKAAHRLQQLIPLSLSGPRPEHGNRMDPLHEVIATLSYPFISDSDDFQWEWTELRPTFAIALEQAHKGLHLLLKPDETAQGRARGLARARDKAADQNAQSIVIHPTSHNMPNGMDAFVSSPSASSPTPAAKTAP